MSSSTASPRVGKATMIKQLVNNADFQSGMPFLFEYTETLSTQVSKIFIIRASEDELSDSITSTVEVRPSAISS